VISDGKTEYLLRKGVDVSMPAGVAHVSPVWGANPSSFNAKRFLQPGSRAGMSEKEREMDREQKRAYIPFGGGKHLCPGRKFAFAEILGTLATLLLGFDVRGVDGGLIRVPEMRRAKIGEGIAKPGRKGEVMGAKLLRREGWEDVQFSFTAGREAKVREGGVGKAEK